MFVPLKLPPGIVRPGTVYDARGRWYDCNLVRWHEGAMQPVGGWEAVERGATAPVTSVLSDDGGVFTDETTDARDAGTNDVILTPATPQVNDALYIGYFRPFTVIEIDTSTVGVGGAVAWEYWNGSSWAAPQFVSDVTNGFTVSGAQLVTLGTDESLVSIVPPTDWARTTVNSVGPLYWVRARVTSAGASGAQGATIEISQVGGTLQDYVPLTLGLPVRGMVSWRANDQTVHVGMGTAERFFVFSEGVLADVTPSGLTTGGADATLTSGNYGAGAYGAGAYGVGDESQDTLVEACTWQVDTFGEDLVACSYADGTIWYWDKSAGGAMTALTNAPTNCAGVVVTPERFVVALGASGDARLVKWSDQADATDWTAAADNQAGDLDLPGSGQIMAGRRSRNETLIWTDVDLHALRYIGGDLVYSLQQLGANWAVSRLAMTVVDGKAVWMGSRGFFVYDGFVRPLLCEVGDYVFNDINRVQASKIVCYPRSEFGEVWWHYPSASSTECDKYVVWDYIENHWSIGSLERTSGVDRGALPYPLAVDASGVVYKHEVGSDYDAAVPYAVSGPVEIGNGERLLTVTTIIPDGRTLSGTELSLYSGNYPTATETLHGPYTLANPTSVRITARQVRLKVGQAQADWRLGTPRLDVIAGSRR